MGASGSSRHPITSWRSSPYFAGRSPLLTLLTRPTQPLCSTIILNPSPLPRLRRRPLSPSEPLSFASFIPWFSLPSPPGTHYDPASFSCHLSRTDRQPSLSPLTRLVPSGGDENFQTPRDRNRIVISRGSRPSAIRRSNSLFLLRPWADVVLTSKVPEAFTLLLFYHRLSLCEKLRPNIYQRLYSIKMGTIKL